MRCEGWKGVQTSQYIFPNKTVHLSKLVSTFFKRDSTSFQTSQYIFARFHGKKHGDCHAAISVFLLLTSGWRRRLILVEGDRVDDPFELPARVEARHHIRDLVGAHSLGGLGPIGRGPQPEAAEHA